MTKHWGKRASFFFLQRNVFLRSWLPLPTHPVVVFTLVCIVYKCFVAASETQTLIHFNPAETRISRFIARCCFSSSWFLGCLYINSLDAFVNSIYLDWSLNFSNSSIVAFHLFQWLTSIAAYRNPGTGGSSMETTQPKKNSLGELKFLPPLWVIASFNDSELFAGWCRWN